MKRPTAKRKPSGAPLPPPPPSPREQMLAKRKAAHETFEQSLALLASARAKCQAARAHLWDVEAQVADFMFASIDDARLDLNVGAPPAAS